MTVWIAQCLCPQRHAIIAISGEAESEVEAAQLRAALRGKLFELLKARAINPWCGICHADRATWKFEVARTRWETSAEALGEIDKVAAENYATGLLYGEINGVRTKH